MKAINNEPGTFRGEVDGSIGRHIMNTDRRPPSHLYDGDAVVRDMLVNLLLSLFGMKNVAADQ